MSDIRSVWNPQTMTADWVMAGPALADDADIETSIVISLFTHRLANADDRLPDEFTPDPIPDRRGWVGDTPVANGAAGGDLYGSRLWLLAREKWTNETRLRAEQYAREALAWLVEDGIANRVDVTGFRDVVGRIDLLVVVHRVDGRVFQRRYDSAWRQIAASSTA